MNRRQFIKRAAIASGLIWVPKTFAQPFSLNDPAFLAQQNAAAASGPPTPDKAWWKFNDGSGSTAADSSGSGNSLSLNTSGGWTTGPNSNGAFTFVSSSTQYGTATNLTNMDFSSGAGTITWWINPVAAYNSSTPRAMWGQSIAGNTDFSAQVFTDNNFYVGWDSTGHDSRVTLAASSANWVSGSWQHFAFTWGASGSVLYRNGASIGTNGTAPTLSNMSSAFYVAKQGAAQPSYISASFDDFRIYSTLLTGTQISAIYAAGAS